MALSLNYQRESGEDEQLQRPIETGTLNAPGFEQEKILEKEPTAPEQMPGATEAKATPSKLPKILRRTLPSLPATKDEITIKIEKIMEDELGDAYSRLSPIAKQEFKIKGEIAAEKIRDLLRATHVKAKKILRLLIEWLKLLPGINKFFLEQEAKIKTDRIVALKK